MAEYELRIKASATKELDGVARKDDRRRIVEVIRSLSDDPRPRGCQKLSGSDRYRIRQGSYRVVYSIDDSSRTVMVVKIGHRRDMYR